MATPETEKGWIEKCRELSNRQLEQEVRKKLPPVARRTLVFALEGDLVECWEQTREALERLSGKTLTDMEVFSLMCAEVLCSYAVTPPFDPNDESDGGYLRSIAERDGWKCARPGCSSRTALTAHHIIPRSRGGSDEDENKITACIVCHRALTQGRLKVRGRAPDELIWEGPFGVIEKPLPLVRREGAGRNGKQDSSDGYPPRRTGSVRQPKAGPPPAGDAPRTERDSSAPLFSRELREIYRVAPLYQTFSRTLEDHVIQRRLVRSVAAGPPG